MIIAVSDVVSVWSSQATADIFYFDFCSIPLHVRNGVPTNIRENCS